MRLLHWNVHMWQDADGKSNLQAVADLIAQVSPDVVSLVEVDEPWGRPGGLRGVADELGYSWAFVPAFEYREEGGFGNALLSRSPFHAVQQWQLLSPRLYDGSEPSEPRALALGQVTVHDDLLWVGSTHLPRNDAAMRAEASALLHQLLGGLDGPWALCGDFNQPASSWLPDSAVTVPQPPIDTYPTNDPVEAIDYCVLGGMTGDGHVLASTASDHLPIVIRLDPTLAA